MEMKLERWRGWNVLLTDGVGLPILRLDKDGNVVEAGGAVISQYPITTASDADGLARSVATWIAWISDEPGEFRGDDIHPQLRERVIALAPDAVEH
jgi:hypothetical protein